MMHGLMSAPFVYSNPQERYLNQDNISVVLAELKETLLGDNRIVCNLSASGLTLDCVSILPAQLKPLKHVYALDLSLNRIRATWQQLLPVVKSFLDGKVVQYLDLSMNYLPALQTLQEDPHVLKSYKSFGETLSFGLDGNPLTGNEEIDHWITAGRRFKQEAYGYQHNVYEQ
ncbi:hypothetical protein ABBQ38_011481 [Trebouxia sp. C0009 RCD-2024]